MQYTAYAIWGIAGLYLIIIMCIYSNVKLAIAVLRAAAAF